MRRYSHWPTETPKVWGATFRPELMGKAASLVRELHISAVPMHERNPRKCQHQGLRTLLMEETEEIAREEHGSGKISVISGVGVKLLRKVGVLVGWAVNFPPCWHWRVLVVVLMSMIAICRRIRSIVTKL